jgi:hypothetical protein
MMSEYAIPEASETGADLLKHDLDGLNGCAMSSRSLLVLSGNVSQKLQRFAVEWRLDGSRSNAQLWRADHKG